MVFVWICFDYGSDGSGFRFGGSVCGSVVKRSMVLLGSLRLMNEEEGRIFMVLLGSLRDGEKIFWTRNKRGKKERKALGILVISHLSGCKMGISCVKSWVGWSHVSNHLPHMQTKVIRTKFQVIRNCGEILEWLVSAGTKIQTSSICRYYRHI